MGAPDGWRLTFGADRTRRDEPGPLSSSALAADRFDSSPPFRFDTNNTRRARIAASYRKLMSLATGEGRVYAVERRADRLRTVLVAPNFPDRSFQALETWTVGASGEVDLPTALGIPHSQIRVGADAAHDRLRTAYQSVDPAGQPRAQIADAEGTRDRVGLFATYTWTPMDRLRVTFGGRWDHIADRFASASGGTLMRLRKSAARSKLRRSIRCSIRDRFLARAGRRSGSQIPSCVLSRRRILKAV
jgi:outer membrane receptor protein involved in Fe transport